MRQKLLGMLLLAIAGAFLTGMGDLGGAPQPGMTESGKDIRARVVDREGVATEVTHFSMEGRTYLEGKRGRGKLSVPFSKVRTISFGEPSGGQVPVELTLNDNHILEIRLGENTAFSGSTGFGMFLVRAEDLQRIEFP